MCVVGDRGMISAASIEALEERELEYILGARERSSAVVRDLVLNDETPFTPLLVERGRGETQLLPSHEPDSALSQLRHVSRS